MRCLSPFEGHLVIRHVHKDLGARIFGCMSYSTRHWRTRFLAAGRCNSMGCRKNDVATGCGGSVSNRKDSQVLMIGGATLRES